MYEHLEGHENFFLRPALDELSKFGQKEGSEEVLDGLHVTSSKLKTAEFSDPLDMFQKCAARETTPVTLTPSGLGAETLEV